MKKHFAPFSKRTCLIAYITVFIVVTLIPLAAMLFEDGSENTDNRTLSQKPQLISQDGINTQFGLQYETYLSEHIGLRQEMISLWNTTQYYLFNTSGVEKVTAGKDGWLFFTEAVNDIKGKTLYSERSIYRIARTTQLMNEYSARKGQLFIFTVAPNKTTVYPQYLKAGTYVSPITNLSRLSSILRESEYYVDLSELFCNELDSESIQYYYKLDSHWNDLGAMEVYRALQQNIADRLHNYTFNNYDEFTTRSEIHLGDLGKMLLPGNTPEEYEQVPVFDSVYTSERPISDPLYYQIETFSDISAPSLFICRDSFGSALIRPLSNNFSHVFYSTALPYKLEQADGYDIIIVEIVERNLLNIVKNAPDAVSPPRQAPADTYIDEQSLKCSAQVDEHRLCIYGSIAQNIPLETTDNIYIEVQTDAGTHFFEAYPISEGNASDDRGYYAIIPPEFSNSNSCRLHIGTLEHTASYSLELRQIQQDQ